MRTLRLPLVLLLTTLLLASVGLAGEEVRVVIFHTNDLHGQVLPVPGTWIDEEDPPPVGGLLTLAACLEKERPGAGDVVLTLDAGDLWQGTPEGNLPEGRLMIDLLNALDYDAMTLGNHEFDAGLDRVALLHGRARFPFLAANVLWEDTGRPANFARPYVVLERGGLRIAILGLLTPHLKEIVIEGAAKGLVFPDALETAKRWIPAIREKEEPDLLLLLTHVGIHDDLRLAAALPEVDAIIGGHSHTGLRETCVDEETGVLVAQTFGKGSCLGRVDLVLDRETREVVRKTSRLIDLPVAEWGRSAKAEAVYAPYAEEIDAVMGRVVGRLATPLHASRKGIGTCSLGGFAAMVFRETAEADLALHNRYGLRSDLAAGEVTYRDLFQVSPFGNTVVRITIPGATLRELLEAMLDRTGYPFDLSGVTVRYDRKARPGERLRAVEIGGVPLDPEKDYLLATNSYLAGGGDGMEILRGLPQEDLGILLRDAYAAYLEAHEEVAWEPVECLLPAEEAAPVGAGTDGQE